MFSYPGSKNRSGVIQHIAQLVPPHKTRIELFGGTFPLSRLLRPAQRNIALEVDSGVIGRFGWSVPGGTVVLNYDARVFIQSLLFSELDHPDTFIYADPPYMIETRLSQDRLYSSESTPELHESILTMLAMASCRIAISHYACRYYDDMLCGWNRYDFQTYDRHRARVESVYFNYPKPVFLHDWSYLGNGFTDRQRIKRKVARHLGKLDGLPVVERNAIISSIIDRYINGTPES